MSDSKLHSYTVQVREKRVFWQTMQVEAASEEEAEQLALEDFQVDWSDSDELETEVTVLCWKERR